MASGTSPPATVPAPAGPAFAASHASVDEDGHKVKRQRFEDDPSGSTSKWSNAAAGHDPFSITRASPPRNKAREILAEVKKQKEPKTKAADGGWGGDDNFIAFSASEGMNFAPPPPGSLTLSGRGHTGRGRGQYGSRRGAPRARGGFSHRDSFHARLSMQQRSVPPTARSFAAGDRPSNTSLRDASSEFNTGGLSDALNAAPKFPHGDKSSKLDQDIAPHDAHSSTNESSTRVAGAASQSRPKAQTQPPKDKSKDEGKQPKKKKRKKQKHKAETLAQPDAAAVVSQPQSKAERGRKRKIDAISQDSFIFANGVTPDWDGDFVPWMLSWNEQSLEGGKLASPEQRLHMEIMGFYDWVRPHSYEENMRYDVVDRLQTFMDDEIGAGMANICVFGSFATGLYLPDADIDAVAIRPGAEGDLNAPALVSKNKLRRLASAFQDQRFTGSIARGGTARAIPHAKVPIIKYVDRVSGLNVDVSFTNKNGLPAVELCKTWVEEQPALAVLVALIKLYLAMREANEVVHGGIGGFSVTCLAYVFLHLRAREQPDFDPMADLGATFLSFLDFYGNEMDLVNIGLTVKPVTLFDKTYRPTMNDNGRLCIIDPSDSTNNIAVGSFESLNILKSFSAVKNLLEERMQELRESSGRYQSILGVIYAGNYRPMEKTRNRLERLADDDRQAAWP